MFFRNKGKLKKEFDEKLIDLIKETKEDLQQTKIIEELLDDYDLEIIAQRKAAESIHYYLFKEARIRRVLIKK
ncbi:YaaL family protein [Lysinibacillus parviboronicapiens]|uniref:YaaL family protein n=1 Tax=Lysinibacillus parviboronicapiens TaxID=436516 RepID=UPI000D3AFD26|nr:YaaL family protein [Lysinibacillus parviboronicapiens]